jgi:sterol desaturase/sphingolipid hydroxylase (fatty acid hydroxylase superfamily)
MVKMNLELVFFLKKILFSRYIKVHMFMVKIVVKRNVTHVWRRAQVVGKFSMYILTYARFCVTTTQATSFEEDVPVGPDTYSSVPTPLFLLLTTLQLFFFFQHWDLNSRPHTC